MIHRYSSILDTRDRYALLFTYHGTYAQRAKLRSTKWSDELRKSLMSSSFRVHFGMVPNC